MDRFDFNPKIKYVANTPQEIMECVHMAINLKESELFAKKQEWKEVVSDLFAPVSDSTYELFIRPKQRS
jgi:hypothetical protein